MLTFKLLKRIQDRVDGFPCEWLMFQVIADGVPTTKTVAARMESDNLDANELNDCVLELAFQNFLDANFDLLHYYMD